MSDAPPPPPPADDRQSRREFFKRLLVLRYAAPLVATYSMKAFAQAGPTPPPDRCCDGDPPPCAPGQEPGIDC
ncbi:MAG: hypothetical protein IT380_09820 [Myxococcales bacterium]|nr:hypothetical protein [Myxococcales bacterium]